jgi:hypothetical protein
MFSDYDENINCFVDNITAIKNLINNSDIKISKNRSSDFQTEFEVTNGCYMYKCKNDIELVQCLKQLSKEQQDEKRRKKTKNKSGVYSDEFISNKVNESDCYIAQSTLNLHEIMHNDESSRNLNLINFCNIEETKSNNNTIKDEIDVGVGVVVVVEKLTKQTTTTTKNSLKISLDSFCSKKDEKNKKISMFNIIARNNLNNKVNKINSNSTGDSI